MSDWVGSGSVISTPESRSCLEYLTVADVRAEFGDEVAEDTDISIQRRIDQMSAFLEDQIGHTFGRAMIARSSDADTVLVTATELEIGGAHYTFADYPTLSELASAVNATTGNYSVELLPRVRPDTPSTLLALHSVSACGPDYDDRTVLCTSSMYTRLTGQYQSHIFLPLALNSVSAVVEDLVALATTDYWAIPGDAWLIRKACGCNTTCVHARGRWSAAYPGYIAVSFVPSFWGRVPGSLSGLLLEAFSARTGLAPFNSETFGDYSYKRPAAPVAGWNDILGSGALRQYATRFQP